METVGKYLKRERELRNVSLTEISAATKIREHLLTAIEEDRHDLLPTPVFVKGFLMSYGKYIGLDPDDVVLRYESDLKELRGYEERGPAEQGKKAWNRGLVGGVIVVIIGIGIILFNAWKEPQEGPEHSPTRAEEVPVVQEEIPPPPTLPEQEDTALPAEEKVTLAEAPPVEPPPAERMSESEEMAQEELTLEIQATEETWLAIQVDSDLPREIILRPGEAVSRRANRRIKLKIGNAGGVNVTFNGKPLGSLGDTGRIVRLSMTHDGYEFKSRDEFTLTGYGDEGNPPDTH
jgi:cytoskeleton protein RodZ